MITPARDRILLQRLPTPTTTEGGIVLPDIVLGKHSLKERVCRVVAVGPGLLEGEVKPGDHVLVGKFSGFELTVDGEEAFIVKHEEVEGVVTL